MVDSPPKKKAKRNKHDRSRKKRWVGAQATHAFLALPCWFALWCCSLVDLSSEFVLSPDSRGWVLNTSLSVRGCFHHNQISLVFLRQRPVDCVYGLHLYIFAQNTLCRTNVDKYNAKRSQKARSPQHAPQPSRRSRRLSDVAQQAPKSPSADDGDTGNSKPMSDVDSPRSNLASSQQMHDQVDEKYTQPGKWRKKSSRAEESSQERKTVSCWWKASPFCFFGHV